MFVSIFGFITAENQAVRLWGATPLYRVDSGQCASVKYLAGRRIAALIEDCDIHSALSQQPFDITLYRKRLGQLTNDT